jgi:signal transduction histidine kinase
VNIKEKSEIGELATTFNRMAADLERDEKLRRDLVADIAHELRSPLTNVRGYLEAIRDGIIVPDEHTVNTIYDETMLLSRLIEDLQELSLAESGQLKLYCQNEDIGNIITQAITAVMAKASIKDIKLSVELPDGLPAVFIDRQRIKQVLLNLLTNALTHTPSGRSITVSAEQVGDHIAVCVADNGEGIPPDELPFIFERFHRVDKSRTRLTGGSGLGLTIARYFVEAHKGTITAWSEPGKGSRFTFTLPAVGA